LNSAGAALLAVGRDSTALAAVKGGALGGHLFVADVTPDMPDRIVAACLERFGTLTTLVNAAGIIATGTISPRPTSSGRR
jgi:NADP-dependent 3-hydroxy acid dehydrogenase YdfG